MSTIADELTRIQNAKASLATSITAKGVEVPASTKIDGYAALVDQIAQGGGIEVYETEVTLTEDSMSLVVEFSTPLARAPKYALALYKGDSTDNRILLVIQLNGIEGDYISQYTKSTQNIHGYGSTSLNTQNIVMTTSEIKMYRYTTQYIFVSGKYEIKVLF